MAHDRRLGFRFVAGADEAGRGCLAGPIVAGGVLLDMERFRSSDARALRDLNDSKRLTDELREELYPIVRRVAVRTAVVSRSAQTIDRDGLHNCNLSALREALSLVAEPGCLCLSDGFAVGTVDGCETEAIIGGDRTSAAIAAASIIAKVSRDRLMLRLAAAYPQWGFEQHVGYSTPAHREAIQSLGITPLHRRSFASTAYQQLDLV